MIKAVAFCPCPPVLIPEIAQGAAPELDDLRAACATAIRRTTDVASQIVVVGAGPRARHHEPTARGSFAPYGLPLEIPLGSDEPGPVELPLSLTVGAWLLRNTLGPNCGATGWSVGPNNEQVRPVEDDVPITLLVMGDGSARRSERAPGYLDARADEFDVRIAQALRSGEGDRLHPYPSVEVGDELLAAGTRVWDEVAFHTESHAWDADLLYDDAPYGVGYFVASWVRRG